MGGVDDEFLNRETFDLPGKDLFGKDEDFGLDRDHIAGNKDHRIFGVLDHQSTGDDRGICSLRDPQMELPRNGDRSGHGDGAFPPSDLQIAGSTFSALLS